MFHAQRACGSHSVQVVALGKQQFPGAAKGVSGSLVRMEQLKSLAMRLQLSPSIADCTTIEEVVTCSAGGDMTPILPAAPSLVRDGRLRDAHTPPPPPCPYVMIGCTMPILLAAPLPCVLVHEYIYVETISFPTTIST